MKPRAFPQGLLRQLNESPTAGRLVIRPFRRHASTSSSSPTPSPPSTPPPKQQRWLRYAFITAAAAGIGALVRSQLGPDSTTLNPIKFTPYYLVSREPVSSTGSYFVLQPPAADGSNHAVYEEAWKTGVWSVMFKQPQLQIGRDYTPLPATCSEDEEDECLRFFIRKDSFGEVSRYLHSLEIGAPIEVRGPRIECEIPPDTQRILFIAGGTGIAPALQAGHTLLRRTNENHKPRIHILWANRRREDCAGGVSETTTPTTTTASSRSWFSGLFTSSKGNQSGPVEPPLNTGASLIVRELEALRSQYPGQVTVDYLVDEEGTSIGKQLILDSTSSGPSSQDSGESKSTNNLILVSGPEGFISYMAGPKLWAEGMELQGPLRGILKELNLKDWAVWKL
ncbi:hypothetical protein ASPBRDRAFT_131689 [Aspergillus brasiliensis CBS 101740]|uniref:FAD-binding FR-type domain-containing protein n=1 Tax=Aspergillus brasiliensis (strain CBS 101740 / IMI 381727 / IBT 21946) TaxID=767769 RepID=A0A1L9UCD4_ASPBC|nr:hypothetical protein ASPBRDRAFT_131689 [Aspergillus brasiliensis CBS 101740]